MRYLFALLLRKLMERHDRDGGAAAVPPVAAPVAPLGVGGDARTRERAATAEMTSPLTRPGLEPGPVAHNPPTPSPAPSERPECWAPPADTHGPFLRLLGEEGS